MSDDRVSATVNIDVRLAGDGSAEPGRGCAPRPVRYRPRTLAAPRTAKVPPTSTE